MRENIKLQGQLSIFDLPLVEKKIENAIKNTVVQTVAPIKIKNLTEDSNKKITDKQQKIIDVYMKNSNLNRIIFCCGGGVEIELLDQEKNFKTIYVNTKGDEEFSYNKKASIIYLDKIIFNRDAADIKRILPG